MHHRSTETIAPEDVNTKNSLARCMVNGNSATRSWGVRERGTAFGLSLIAEASALFLIIVSPLLSGVARPQIIRSIPPMMVNLAGWRSQNAIRSSVPHARQPDVSLPTWNFRPQPIDRAAISQPIADPDESTLPGLPGDYLPGAIPMNDLNLTAPRVQPPPTVERAPLVHFPVKVSEGVQLAQLILRIEPRYPPLALQARREGTVILHAIISRDGRITALEVVSGPALLVQAALDAVRQWRYRPTLLGSEPVEVETTITVTFQLER